MISFLIKISKFLNPSLKIKLRKLYFNKLVFFFEDIFWKSEVHFEGIMLTKNNKILTPEFIGQKEGSFLHRFNWLKDEEIGELPKSWNWLAMEYEEKKDLDLIHYTLGTPCFKEYSNKSLSKYWKLFFKNHLAGIED